MPLPPDDQELSELAAKQLEKMLSEPSHLTIKAQSLQAYKDGDYLTTNQLRPKLINEYVDREVSRGCDTPYPLPKNTYLILSERPMGGDWFKVKSIGGGIDGKWHKSDLSLEQYNAYSTLRALYWIARENW